MVSPVIPATWEAEIRRIKVLSQSRQKELMRPHLHRKKLGMVVHACHPSNGGKCKIRGS
jgi:hypothetical protein